MNYDASNLVRAAEEAKRSPDLSKKVGCVIASTSGRPLVVGFNDFPDRCLRKISRLERPEKYDWLEHAERKALNHAARHGIAVEGATAYVTYFPCSDCARSLADSGISRVVSPMPDCTHPRWGDSWRIAINIFQESGVQMAFMEVPSVPE